MSKAYDALMKELEDEQQSAPTETATPAETNPAPSSEEQPAETPAETNPTPEETPAPSSEEQPAETPKPSEEQPAPQKKPSEYTPEERAQFAFNRQLAKERQKHQAELEEIKSSFQKQIDELKKSTVKPEPRKTRADFENDDAYIKYLADKQVNEIMAERDKKASEDAAEKARQQAEQDEQNRILQSEQQAWLTNVDSAFGEDAKGKQAFLSRLQTCLDKGLGAVLDACPVAADYLLHNANGPKVMEKMLADRATFERVFNERTTPLDSYYELRQIEAELRAQKTSTPAPTPSPTPAPAPQNFPHIGRPGKGGNATEPDVFSDPVAMRNFLRSGH